MLMFGRFVGGVIGLIIITTFGFGGWFFKLNKLVANSAENNQFGPEYLPSLNNNHYPLSTTYSTEKVEIPILMYHHIRDYQNANDPLGISLSVTPESFKKQLAWLINHGYQSIDLDTAIYLLQTKQTLPVKPVVLTFDDGYRDAYTNALPILEEYRQIGVFYIAPGLLNNPNYLTSKQVKELSDRGMMVADHSLNHLDLTKQSTLNLYRELSKSKKSLEQLIEKPVDHLAYPFGRYNNEILDLAKGIDYKTAVTVEPGFSTSTHDLLRLPRFRIKEKTNFEKLLDN